MFDRLGTDDLARLETCWGPFLGLLGNDRREGDRFHRLLRGTIVGRLGHAESALTDDLVSGTVLKLLRRLDRELAEGSEPIAWSRGYFRTAADHSAQDYLRALRRQNAVFSADEIDETRQPSTDPTAEDRLQAAEVFLRSRQFLIDCAERVGPDARRAWMRRLASNAVDADEPLTAAQKRREDRLNQKTRRQAALLMAASEVAVTLGEPVAQQLVASVSAHGNQSVPAANDVRVRKLRVWLETCGRKPEQVVERGMLRLDIDLEEPEAFVHPMAQVLERALQRVTAAVPVASNSDELEPPRVLRSSGGQG
ncbi:MAG: hypothetical protein AAFU79_01445 [Myxococcota bacterium]